MTGLADESSVFALDAGAGIAATSQMYAEIESRLQLAGEMETVALRYGFFCGPNTWCARNGAAVDHLRRQESATVGRGEGTWSFVHIQDAAIATVAALSSPPGIYSIVDNDPSPANAWLPAFAKYGGAPQPNQFTEQEARVKVGEDAIYYGTRLQGSSNRKARSILGFKPRQLEWLLDSAGLYPSKGVISQIKPLANTRSNWKVRTSLAPSFRKSCAAARPISVVPPVISAPFSSGPLHDIVLLLFLALTPGWQWTPRESHCS